MRRRTFIAGLGGAAAWPVVAWAQQQPERMRRIGILMPFPPGNATAQERVRAFREELRKRGWASSVNVQFDERWTVDNMELIHSAAENLVELKPDVILAAGGRVIPILMKLTRSIPIVYPGGTEPVARGYVESLAHPGGNVTGFAVMENSVIGKQLQTLKEIAPHLTRISMIYNPDNPAGAIAARAFEDAARPLGVEATIVHIHGLSDIERAAETIARQDNGGIFVALDVTIEGLARQTVATIAQHRLPAIYPDRLFVVGGGLVSYGADRTDLFRRAATYVDRILRGEKPGDLPYQQPTKYDLVINLGAAKALGLTIPPKLLFTADEVIE
jgi:putative tryptophan/tyrosine transport system substrate-binding protein